MSEKIKRTQAELLDALTSVINAKRIYRDEAADFVLRNPETFPYLISILFETENPIHIKAAWITELVCLQNPAILMPQLDTFISHLPALKNDSALRPVAKICRIIAGLHFSEKGKAAVLTEVQKAKMVEACFDWLIREEKTATQVYAMSALAMFSIETEWIREDLTGILQKDFNNKSPGYQSHAKMLLPKLSKK
ncbi:MAG: hypothetical protein U5K51_14870 [Flavobacteriaceae bacterium]|nr:hypothetical protein [Flavobacteriaceae bacterium]